MQREMKRPIGMALAAIALALAVACGPDSGSDQPGAGAGGAYSLREDLPLPAVPAAASPTAVVRPTVRSSPVSVADLPELALDESDVPPRFSSVKSTILDLHIDYLNPSVHTVPAGYTFFVSGGYKETITSTVALMGDATVEKFFSQADYLSVENLQALSDMLAAEPDTAPMDFRELDVSGLGDMASGYGLTSEIPGEGVLYNELVFFGHGPLLGSVQTTAVGGAPAVQAVPLAQKMAEKMEAVIH